MPADWIAQGHPSAMSEPPCDGARSLSHVAGGGAVQLTRYPEDVPEPAATVGFLELEVALQRLEGVDPVRSQSIELRLFDGLTCEEIGSTHVGEKLESNLSPP